MFDEAALVSYFGFLETESGAKRVKLRANRSARTWDPRVLYATLEPFRAEDALGFWRDGWCCASFLRRLRFTLVERLSVHVQR